MNKTSDQFIGKVLKSWVDRHKPPVNARARLLAAAAYPTPKVKTRQARLPDYRYYPPHAMRSDEYTKVLLILLNETVLRSGLQLRVI